MTNPALPTMPVNDYLTRKLLRKISGTGTPLTALLEQLVTDSVYTLKDDFDKGLNTAVWETEGLVDLVADEGSLVSDGGEEDTQGMSILSVGSGWRLNRRPCFQARVDFSPTSRPDHFEMGFTSDRPENFGLVTALTASATSRNVRAQTFAVVARDADFTDPDHFYNVSAGPVAGGNATAQVGSTIVTPNPALAGPMTLLVCANEQGETRLWINGQHDNSFSEEADVVADEDLHLWMFGTKGSYSIDYIQAWRERTSL